MDKVDFEMINGTDATDPAFEDKLELIVPNVEVGVKHQVKPRK